MSDLHKAMVLVGLGTFLLTAILAAPLLMTLRGNGEVLVLPLAFASVIGSVAMTWVIRRHQGVERRKQREAVLLRK